jgi:hypothetical protein
LFDVRLKSTRSDLTQAGLSMKKARKRGPFSEADERIRTADPIITSDVLYQLSYVGRAL